MIRRDFLLGSSALSMAVPLAGCGGAIFNSATVTSLAADARIVLQAIENTLKALVKAAVPGMSTGVIVNVQNALAGIESAVTAIMQAAPETDPTDLSGKVGAIAGYVNAVIAAIAPLAFIPSPVAAYLNAAVIIIPVLAAAVQITVSMLKPPPPPHPIPSVDAARAVATTPAS
jgi:hypothetical protein